MGNQANDPVNIREEKPKRVDETTLRHVIGELERSLQKPAAYGYAGLAVDAFKTSVSVWSDKAVKRSVQGWILKIAYDYLGHSHMAAHSVMAVLNAKVREKTGESIEGLEAEDGPEAVLEALESVFWGEKK